MSDTQALYFVAVLIYLCECVSWANADGVAFTAVFRNPWRWTRPSSLIGNRSGGVLLRFPLPPLGKWCLCQVWPISVSPTGVFSLTPFVIGRDAYPERPARFISFQEMDTVATAAEDLLINGRPFARAASGECAKQLARLLRALRDMPQHERSSAIEHAVEDTLNTAFIRASINEYERKTLALRWFANALLIWIFIAVPVASWTLGWMRTWPFLLLGAVLGLYFVVRTFYRCHLSLFPTAQSDRWKHTLLMTLNPLSAVRAHDAISRNVLAKFHPLAVAQVLCSTADYRKLARCLLVDLHYPLEPLFAEVAEEAREVGEWFRGTTRLILDRFVHASGIDVATLLAPDPPGDETCRTYCPRCQCQYVVREGNCVNCGGIRLRQFAART